MNWLLGLVFVAGCSNEKELPPKAERPVVIPVAEVQRALDACQAYVAKVCTCGETVPAAKETCALAKALPEAIDVGKRLAANPQADREDALQAADSIRKTVKQCIEQTANLSALGCP